MDHAEYSILNYTFFPSNTKTGHQIQGNPAIYELVLFLRITVKKNGAKNCTADIRLQLFMAYKEVVGVMPFTFDHKSASQCIDTYLESNYKTSK